MNILLLNTVMTVYQVLVLRILKVIPTEATEECLKLLNPGGFIALLGSL